MDFESLFVTKMIKTYGILAVGFVRWSWFMVRIHLVMGMFAKENEMNKIERK